jgi:hypothetical protein
MQQSEEGIRQVTLFVVIRRNSHPAPLLGHSAETNGNYEWGTTWTNDTKGEGGG